MIGDHDYWLLELAAACRSLEPSQLSTAQLAAITAVLRALSGDEHEPAPESTQPTHLRLV